MKWIYLPALFITAFVYTKYSFNNFLPKKVGISRAPASVGGAEVEEIQYQFVLKKDQRKIPQKFFKILQSSQIQDSFKELNAFRGKIIEDTQMEHFHFAKNKKGKSIFVLKNSNNSVEGYFHNDLLVHLISIRQVDQQIDWKSYFESYKKGLLAQKHELSFYMEKELENVDQRGEAYFYSNVDVKKPFRFKSKDARIEESELKPLMKTLSISYPSIEFFDSLKKTVSIGSMDNLLSYQLLVRLKPHEKIKWLEITEKRDQQGIESIDAVEFFNKVLKINGKIFLMIDLESSGVPFFLSQYHQDEYKDIALDQANLLGVLHRQTLGLKVDDYISALSKLDSSQIEETVIMLKFKLRDILDEKEI